MKKRLVAVLVLLAAATGLRAPARAETPAERRLRHLEEQLEKAQQEIKELKAQMQQQRAIGQATQRQAEQAEESAKTATTAAAKPIEVPDWLKKTTIFGDVRARHEGFYHQPHAKGAVVTARNRDRIRARLGLRFALTDELSATVRMASGNPDDPISTNETLTGNFNRKHVNLDWAYLTFTPGKSFNLRPGVASVTLGKFPNPIFRVGEMVFDDDLSPEGASETFQVLDKPIGSLDQIRIHALQWTFNEVSNNQDGWMFGGQVNPAMHFGTVQLEAGLGQYWWLNPDQIAQALDPKSASVNKALFNSNLLDKDASGKILGYTSAFNQTNATAAVTVPDVVGTQPVRLFADYVYNWLAATDDAHGWMAGARLGQTKVRNDWSLYGFYEHIGQEAAISAFTYSDFGLGGTNVEGPVVGVDYQLLNPLTLTVRSHFTNFINRPAATTNPTLTRLQLDALVKF